jgi:hypothetical protein
MAGVPALPHGTSALPEFGPVPRAEMVMSGARVSKPVSGNDGRHRGEHPGPAEERSKLSSPPIGRRSRGSRSRKRSSARLFSPGLLDVPADLVQRSPSFGSIPRFEGHRGKMRNHFPRLLLRKTRGFFHCASLAEGVLRKGPTAHSTAFDSRDRTAFQVESVVRQPVAFPRLNVCPLMTVDLCAPACPHSNVRFRRPPRISTDCRESQSIADGIDGILNCLDGVGDLHQLSGTAVSGSAKWLGSTNFMGLLLLICNNFDVS